MDEMSVEMDYGMILEDAIDYSKNKPSVSQPMVQHEKSFEKYDGQHFLSFVHGACEEKSSERVLNEFKEWIFHCDIQSFLYTFEPKPNIFNLSLGKCPYLHTAETSEEKIARNKQLVEEEKIRKDLEEFVKKRITLIQRLITVYKKAKKGIEHEYQINFSKKDPYCEYKRKMATKRIVDMMIKQFALEYLYLKSMKIRNEIEIIHCIFIDTDRSRHLKNLHRYTLRTAEKLRCLLEKECSDNNENFERYFKEKTLRDMARMYLNEVERLAASISSFSSSEWSSDCFWESTSSKEKVEPENDSLTDFFETNLAHEDVQILKSESTSDVENNHDHIPPDEPSIFAENLDDSLEKEIKLFPEEDAMLTGSKSDNIELLGEESYKNILTREDSHNTIGDTMKEILKSDEWLTGESEEVLHVPKDEEACEDIRIAQLNINKGEIEMLEAFKRELWLIDAFHYFTTNVKPELKGRYKLLHVKSIYDELIPVEKSESIISLDESGIQSSLIKCFTYLNQEPHKKISGVESSLPATDQSLNLNESGHIENKLNSKVSDNKFKHSVFAEQDKMSMKTSIEFEKEVGSKLSSTESALRFINNKEDMIENNSYNNSHKKDGSSLEQVFQNHLYEVKSTEELEHIALERMFDESKEPSQVSRSGPKKLASKITWDSGHTGVSCGKISLPSREGYSIPSFSGSIPDALKQYRQCMKNRDGGIREVGSLPDSVGEEINIQALLSKVENSFDQESLESNRHNDKTNISINNSSSQSSQEFSNYKTNRDCKKMEPTIESVESECFPTLMEVLNHFTKTLKDQVDQSENGIQVENEEHEEDNQESLVDWNKLLDIKWKSSKKIITLNQNLDCEFDTARFIKQLHEHNCQYFINHPEISGLIRLILREFSMKRPEEGFIQFIKDTLFNKNFANQLSSYLAVNNKAYRRRLGLEGNDFMNQPPLSFIKETSNMFTFDKPSLQCWKEWGVDYKTIYGKYGPNNSQETTSSNKSVSLEDTCKDSWDLTKLMDRLNLDKLKGKKGYTIDASWTNFLKSLVKDEMLDLKKEITCVNAISDEVKWKPPTENRSECHTLFKTLHN